MSSFWKTFANRRVVLPVVHVANAEQALRNVRIAWDAGADGVFLINHHLNYRALLSIHADVISAFPRWWVGVNCLDVAPEEVFSMVSDQVSGVWVDDAMIREYEDFQPDAERVRQSQRRHHWKGLYFGGVAFKYQRPVSDLKRAAEKAARYMDVVTTSGPGTGQPAPVRKIEAMKDTLGDHPLAIASGITPENVAEYTPMADCFLVATGISRTFEEFDPKRVRSLVDRVRSPKQFWGEHP